MNKNVKSADKMANINNVFIHHLKLAYQDCTASITRIAITGLIGGQMAIVTASAISVVKNANMFSPKLVNSLSETLTRTLRI